MILFCGPRLLLCGPYYTVTIVLYDLLKPIVESRQHILKNSTQLIIELEQVHVTDNSILITADVKSLYPNIPIKDSI